MGKGSVAEIHLVTVVPTLRPYRVRWGRRRVGEHAALDPIRALQAKAELERGNIPDNVIAGVRRDIRSRGAIKDALFPFFRISFGQDE